MRAAILAITLLAVPLTAAAQRAGLPIESLAFDDTQRVDVDVSDPHGWVRVSFTGQRTVRLDVRVTRNVSDAHAAVREVLRTTSGELAPMDIADLAFGDDRFIVFSRDNIAVVVRSEHARRDASVVDSAIGAAPRGAPDLSPITVSPQLAVGVPTPIAFGPDVITAHVVAHGPAVARRTHQGWIVTRTSPGAVRLETRACDALLRRR